MTATNSQWMVRRHAALPRGVGQGDPVFAVRAANAG
jgi:hypothetical protein